MVPETETTNNEEVEPTPTDTKAEIGFNFIDNKDDFFRFCDEGIRDLLNTNSKKWYDAEDMTSHLQKRYDDMEKNEMYNTMWYITIWHNATNLGTYNWNIYRFNEREKNTEE